MLSEPEMERSIHKGRLPGWRWGRKLAGDEATKVLGGKGI